MGGMERGESKERGERRERERERGERKEREREKLCPASCCCAVEIRTQELEKLTKDAEKEEMISFHPSILLNLSLAIGMSLVTNKPASLPYRICNTVAGSLREVRKQEKKTFPTMYGGVMISMCFQTDSLNTTTSSAGTTASTMNKR